jgi:hypothetical protein
MIVAQHQSAIAKARAPAIVQPRFGPAFMVLREIVEKERLAITVHWSIFHSRQLLFTSW